MLDALIVSFSPQARQDLRELESYLGRRFSRRNARIYINRVIAACKTLGMAPYSGTPRTDIRQHLRQTGFERRITIYFILLEEQRKLVIASVLYGGKQVDADSLQQLP